MQRFIQIAMILGMLQPIFSQDKSIKNDSIKPLAFYMEHAVTHSPAIKMRQSLVSQKELELQLLKYAWMREIYVTADTKYGSYGNGNPIENLNLGYGTGAFVRLPLTLLVGYSERKKIAKLEIEATQFEKGVIEEEVKKMVIHYYSDVILKMNLIDIRVNSVDIAIINLKLAEEDYKAGNTVIEQYARVSDIYYTQLTELEKAKNQYLESYALLKEVCGLN
jgi:outer membrane protein TolC